MGFGERLRALRSKEKTNYPVSVLCRMLKVSRSGYYDWKDRPLSRRDRENVALMEKIREVHDRSRRTYSYPRVRAELRALGVRCSRKRVARLMCKAALCRAAAATVGSTSPVGISTPQLLPT